MSIKNRLDKISPSFCTLPWIHSTIHLYLGKTHSCHHAPAHDISQQEIKDDPSCLHNTQQKKITRKDALQGIQAPDCSYCWNIENVGGISDRLFKNNDPYAEKYIDKISNVDNVNPTYLEISFSNKCNFRCGYCYPQVSSKWLDEIKEHGQYELSSNSLQHYNIDFIKNYNFYDNEENPYIDAFWKWFPTLINNLEILRITGGEPLLHSSTFTLLKMLEDRPKSKLTISINSNLGVTNRRIKRLCSTVAQLKENKKIKRFRLFTSIDSWGKKAEYMRHGLDIILWEKNLRTVLSAGFEVMLMCTYNALAVSSFTSLLEKIVEWRKEYGFDSIRFDAPYLRTPEFWAINILPSDFDIFIKDSIKFIENNKTYFRDDEYDRMKRLLTYKQEYPFTQTELMIYKKDFYTFFTTNDKRLDTSFSDTFPEYQSFLDTCKKGDI
jgi:organic radical activating enzyme